MVSPIFQVDDVLLSSDILTEYFCCDYEKCRGICCVEGDAGAPVTLDEIGKIEDRLDSVWNELHASSQAIIDKQGVAYTDRDGDLVTSIVGGRECVFAKEEAGCWICTLERAYRRQMTTNSMEQVPRPATRDSRLFIKPISCSLYPIREKKLSNGLVALNYNRWEVCKDAIIKGKEQNIRIWQFLKEPLTRRFGEEWYHELEQVEKLWREKCGGRNVE